MKLLPLLYTSAFSLPTLNPSSLSGLTSLQGRPSPRYILTAPHISGITLTRTRPAHRGSIIPLKLTQDAEAHILGGGVSMTDEEKICAQDHPVFTTPETYHEANRIYLASQADYPFRFPIINPNHLRSNETYVDTFGNYQIYVVQAQHNNTQELVPHVVTYVKRWGRKQVVNQLALPISILPWVMNSIEEVYQPGVSTVNPPYKQSMSLSQDIFEDFIRVRMEVIPDVRLTGGDECTISIMSLRRCSNGRSSSQMRGDPYRMNKDAKALFRKIYLQYAPPEDADAFRQMFLDKLRKK